MSRGYRSALCSAVTVLLFSSLAFAAPVSGTSATAGVRFGDGASGGFVDFVLPVVATEKGVGFINPRFSLEDHRENELNLGAGWRQLAFGGRVLLGGNLYFDSRYTEHNNRFNQLGVGLEVLSQWLDARANYYLPEDTRELIASQETETVETSAETSKKSSAGYGDPYATGHEIVQDYTLSTLTTTTTTTTTTRRLFEQFESAMEGFDAEIGALLPLPSTFPAVRLFGGYYSYEDVFGNRVEGPKGRVEVRIGSLLTLDAEVFDDDELNGSNYFAGARVDTPFDFAALFAGKNPFAGWNAQAPSPAALAARMNEMVMRDPSVQTRASELAENEQARKVEVAVDATSSLKTSTRTYVLMDGVTFVDDSNISGIEDGTAEKPYSEIQAGVDASGANATVYVYGGDYSSVTLVSGVTLWGEGTAVQGYGGKQLGGGAYPTISGASPAVTVASDTRVTGFHITNTDDHGIYGENTDGSVTIDNNIIEITASSDQVSAYGILLETGDAGVTISGNSIFLSGRSGSCIGLENWGNTSAAIDGNALLGGTGVRVNHIWGALMLAVTENSIDSPDTGVEVYSQLSGSVTAEVSGNTVAAVQGMIFEIFQRHIGGVIVTNNSAAVSPDATMTVVANGNTVNGGVRGIGFINQEGTMAVSAAGNTVGIHDSLGSGVDVGSIQGNTTATLTGNTVNLNNALQRGIVAIANSSRLNLAANVNTVNVGAWDTNEGIDFLGYDSEVTLTASGNDVTGDTVEVMLLVNTSGTFVVNAAAPGTSGDLSALNSGINVFYNPDASAFTFLP